MKLDIYLPTFQRPESLARTLGVLMPQVLARQDVRLTILDNASVDEFGRSLEYVIPEHPRVRLHRNVNNIGGCANFLQGFQWAEAEWVWLLSDDDDIKADAVEKIFARMADDVDYITFSIPLANALTQLGEAVRGVGVRDLLALFDDQLMVAVFISSSVYRTEVMKRYLREGYDGVHSGISQTVLALRSIEDGSAWLACPECIVDYVVPEEGQWWDRFNIFSRLPEVETIFGEEDTRRVIRECVKKCRQIDPEMAMYYVRKRFGEDSRDLAFYFKKLLSAYCPDAEKDLGLYQRWMGGLRMLSREGVQDVDCAGAGMRGLAQGEEDAMVCAASLEQELELLRGVVLEARSYQRALEGNCDAQKQALEVCQLRVRELELLSCEAVKMREIVAEARNYQVKLEADLLVKSKDFEVQSGELERVRGIVVEAQTYQFSLEEELARKTLELEGLRGSLSRASAFQAELEEEIKRGSVQIREISGVCEVLRAELAIPVEVKLREKLREEKRGLGKLGLRYWGVKLKMWLLKS